MNRASGCASRKVSLRVAATSRLFLFASFLFRPLIFFVVPGLLLLLVAGWTLGVGRRDRRPAVRRRQRRRRPPAVRRLRRGLANRPQSFVVGGVAFVVAVQLISLGVLATQAKRYFEELFHLQTGLLRRVDRLSAATTRVPLAAERSAGQPEAIGR